MIEFRPEVTKEFILSKVSEEEIFELYGVPVVPYIFRCPAFIRSDRDPTCKFYRRRNGKLILRDYAGYFWGDCFDLACKATGKNFYDVLDEIAVRFKLIEGSLVLNDLVRTPATPAFKIETNDVEIRIKRMAWTHQHYSFWEKIGVSRVTLDKFRVFPLERAWLEKEQIFWYGVKKELAFAYHFPDYGPYEYKLYFPGRDKYRFVHANANILQGYHLLPREGPLCVVTKSYKDVIALSEFGIPACSPMSENQIVVEAEARDLANRFEKIVTFYDIDKRAGVNSMQKMKKLYGWQPLFLYSRMRANLQPKDFTDFYQKYGRYETYTMVDTVRSYF